MPCDPIDENIKQFVTGSQSLLKSLENFIAKSLKIHVDYLIAIRNQEKPSYSEDVLKKIKKLNQLTFHLTIPSTS
ncbi:16002_t:CDS:2 [Cetraspora pellucida]|uniref:16002_t:CDS:1 n=1 Tax=Cetraspora pellucida TaxID=1433469 RepID=A0A9N9I6J9_9GLOM|nr:16002_t:CDS:2 [Cetraspora pellucida]